MEHHISDDRKKMTAKIREFSKTGWSRFTSVQKKPSGVTRNVLNYQNVTQYSNIIRERSRTFARHSHVICA
jgi:hypothetical protein